MQHHVNFFRRGLPLRVARSIAGAGGKVSKPLAAAADQQEQSDPTSD